LPALLHRLNNVTQVLAGVNSLVRLSASSAPLVQRAGDLEHASDALGRLGWLVGALARGMGTGIGSARQEEHALEWLLELLAESLRREGRELVRQGTLPRLDPRRGFETSWAIASWLHAAAQNAEAGASITWDLRAQGQRLVLRSSSGPAELEVWRARIETLVPASALACEVHA